MKKGQISILVTGSEGQVGYELRTLAPQFSDFVFLYIDVKDLDITDKEAVMEFFSKNKIDYCINCAAYTAVDKAEEQKELAHLVNAVGVKHLLDGCNASGGKLIQLSTDYVYHNNQNTPFNEGDETNPRGVYARTKLQGDEIALAGGGMVIRTSWVYSSHGYNFVKTMLRLGREKEELGIIFDQIGTPTYAQDLALAILKIIAQFAVGEAKERDFSGVYHYSNEGVTSWYDFALSIFEIKGIEVKVKAIETRDYPTAAERPPFSLLNKRKIKETFGLDIPHWRKSLSRCLALLDQATSIQ